jgi:acetyl-CoA carboxylase biotin carboxyl carrier protein
MIRNGVRSRSRIPGAAEATDTSVVPAERAAPAAVASDTGIDATLMRQLAQLISESDLAELEVEKGDLRIRLVRYSPAPATQVQGVAPAAAIPAAVVLAAPPAPVVSPSDADHPGTVKSPMVGTAYRRASPDSKAFVEIGSVVKAGEKLMLVEAMKTFNEILAPKAGTVTALFIDDGQPVEYGQPLLVIE